MHHGIEAAVSSASLCRCVIAQGSGTQLALCLWRRKQLRGSLRGRSQRLPEGVAAKEGFGALCDVTEGCVFEVTACGSPVCCQERKQTRSEGSSHRAALSKLTHTHKSVWSVCVRSVAESVESVWSV